MFCIDGSPLEAPEHVIDLGITMSKSLTFHGHIKRMMAKCYRKLLIIKKWFYVTNPEILKLFYVSYIRPTLEYGSVIWAPHNRAEIDLLVNFQTNILSLHGHNINMESLDARRTHNDLCWHYSILHNYTCFDAIKFFELNRPDCYRGHVLSTVVPRITTSAFKFAFAQRKITQWNVLPSHVAGAQTLSHIKKLIFSHII